MEAVFVLFFSHDRSPVFLSLALWFSASCGSPVAPYADRSSQLLNSFISLSFLLIMEIIKTPDTPKQFDWANIYSQAYVDYIRSRTPEETSRLFSDIGMQGRERKRRKE
ncbi:MAG: hypothetical protein KBD00_01045 [Candidatus Peribacteraceae bacterium]|nr:hypothetical protein [Candidatus Peribacteraceae bacterium]